jgi:ABC-type transport system substrate-binding protein
MNVATPPFDDLRVRKAVNLALDKARLVQLFVSRRTPLGWRSAEVARHIVPDAFENNLLLDYDPYSTAGNRGDRRRARAEMARSKYDADGDGRCDAAACRRVLGFAFPAFVAIADTVAKNLRQIGIEVKVRTLEPGPLFAHALDPRNHVPLLISVAWFKDFGGGSSFFVPTFYGPAIGDPATNSNFSLLGASRAQLAGWGYQVRSVPNIDPKIEECLALLGNSALECWAET